MDEKETRDGVFASTSCWSNKPNGRGHIDVIVRASGTETISPIKQKETLVSQTKTNSDK